MVKYLDPVDRHNSCIDVWVKRIPRESHHVWTAFHVELVLPSTKIVSGVVHGHRVPLFEAIAGDEHFAAVVFCEGGRFLFIRTVEDASKEVILEIWDEVLRSVSNQCAMNAPCVE